MPVAYYALFRFGVSPPTAASVHTTGRSSMTGSMNFHPLLGSSVGSAGAEITLGRRKTIVFVFKFSSLCDRNGIPTVPGVRHKRGGAAAQHRFRLQSDQHARPGGQQEQWKLPSGDRLQNILIFSTFYFYPFFIPEVVESKDLAGAEGSFLSLEHW